MELNEKADICMTAINPIPTTTTATKDSINDIPLIFFLSIYFCPFVSLLSVFIDFYILKSVQSNLVSLINI